MKQPLIFIPPAQAEALYDATLSEEQRGRRTMKSVGKAHLDEWDDGVAERHEKARSNGFNEVPRRNQIPRQH